MGLEAVPGADHYRASLLKKKLLQDWQNVSFFQNKGYSDIIVSSDISVREAIRAACDLACNAKDLNESDSFREITDDEDQVVHQAVGILR